MEVVYAHIRLSWWFRRNSFLGLKVTIHQLLTMLAERQLMLEQSVILDSVASIQTMRDTWKHLAEQYQAERLVIETICSDEAFHRSQLNSGERNIPGWHELQWSDVENVKGYFSPWVGERLILDVLNPFGENLVKAIAYCE